MFSRGSRTSGRHARDDRSRREQSLAEELDAEEPAGEEAARRTEPARASLAEEEAARRTTPPEPAGPAGPYDLAEAPAGVSRLDLGSLKVPSVSGVEVRVQANQEGSVQQVYLVHGESVLQLGVFAAPRTDPIWDEVRAEIRRSLFDDGVAAEETPGEYGTELRARVRTQEGLRDLRFVGVDGPRWMVRAVYQGPAATDPAAAGPLAECLRGVVVDRGEEARPIKEPLPLRLSAQLAEQVQNRNGAAAADPASGPNGAAIPNGAGAPGGGAPNGASAPAGGAPAGAPPRRRPSPRPRRPE